MKCLESGLAWGDPTTVPVTVDEDGDNRLRTDSGSATQIISQVRSGPVHRVMPHGVVFLYQIQYKLDL